MTLLLASTSPRRQEILRNLGVRFQVVATRFQEPAVSSHPHPPRLAREYALQKMEHADIPAVRGLAVSADTLVFLGTEILGKPGDREDARRMLTALSGRNHEVVTALCLRDLTRQDSVLASTTTRVVFDPIPGNLMERYLDREEWTDKAGAYGIQGMAALFIREIEGCFFNVVGFPVNLFYQKLHQLGYRLEDFQSTAQFDRSERLVLP
jgi:septum formation protein